MKIFAYNDFILRKYNGKIYGDDSHILFIKETVETHFSEFKLGSRLIENSSPGHYLFNDQANKVLVLPFYKSVSNFFTNPGLFKKASLILKNEVQNYDVFWLTWPHPVSFLILLAVGKKKPVVLFVRQNLEALIEVRYRGLNRIMGKLFTRFMYAYARVFHSNALLVSVGEEMYKVLGKSFVNAAYVSDSIVPKSAQTGPKLAISHPVKLLFVGRLEPEKALPILLEAVEILKERTDVHLTIVGEGDSRSLLDQLIVDKNLNDQVSFAGYLPFGEELFELYRTHDLLMISSYSEGLPKIINEARAFALPIITTRVGGIAKELVHEKSCIFVDSGSASQLADAVLRLLNEPEMFHLISKNLHQEFETNSLEYWSGYFADLVKKHAGNEK